MSAQALCPHGLPLADNVCGPCSKGRPNRQKPQSGVGRGAVDDAALAALLAERDALHRILRERGGHRDCPSSVGRDCYCGWEEFLRDGTLEYLK